MADIVTDLRPTQQCQEEIFKASLHQVLRRNDDRRNKEIMRTESLVLSEASFAGHERRVNLLDKEYDRLLRALLRWT